MHSLADLSLSERIALYTTTFEKHGHQVTLQHQHFRTAVHNTSNNNNNVVVTSRTSQTAAAAAAAAVDVDVELGPPESQQLQRDDEDDDYNANSSNNIVHNRRRSGERHRTTSYVADDANTNANATTTTTNNNKEEDGTPKDLVLDIPHLFTTTCDSQCIICLDDFVIDETIVYSENTTCQHIFHKACMVQYLAQNAQRTKSLRTLMTRGDDEDTSTGTGHGHGNHETTTTRSRSPAGRPTTLHTTTLLENPCPTCRQPHFCRIREGELRKALRKKNTRKYSSTTTTKEDTTTTTTNNGTTTPTTIAIDRSRFDR